MNGSITGIFWLLMASAFLLNGCIGNEPAPGNKSPYGHWWLLNPEIIQPDLIAGGLAICEAEHKASCGGEEVMLVLLEKNTGHGCTDYVGMGTVKQNPASQQWQIYLADEGKLNIWATAVKAGSSLTLKLAGSSRDLKLEQSSQNDIDKQVKDACKESLKDYIKINKPAR